MTRNRLANQSVAAGAARGCAMMACFRRLASAASRVPSSSINQMDNVARLNSRVVRWTLNFAAMRIIQYLLLSSASLTAVARVDAQSGQSAPAALASQVKIIGQPKWWLSPIDGNVASQREAHLYFSVVVENGSVSELSVNSSFRAYGADGSPHSACGPFGLGGGGEPAFVAAGERALIVCTNTVVPRSVYDLQVTNRIVDVVPQSDERSNLGTLADVGLAKYSGDFATDETFTASALIHSKSAKDVRLWIRFRFYDRDGIQTATCDSKTTLVQPEVAVKATCGLPIRVPSGLLAPATVKAELRRSQ